MSNIEVTKEIENKDGSITLELEGVTPEEFDHIMLKGLRTLIDEATEEGKHGLVITEHVEEIEDNLKELGAEPIKWELSEKDANNLFQVGAISILQESFDRWENEDDQHGIS